MTRWGLIADVHGNLAALERALTACQERGAERFAFLGDLLGRGDSEACVALIQTTAALSVVGNRDLDWRDRVNPEARSYVLGLPRQARGSDFLAVHGDARLTHGLGTADLPRGFARGYDRLVEQGLRLIFFGHSHQARAWRKSRREAALEPLVGQRIELPAEPGLIYLVNVGTTGLPFPGKGPPSCAVYDDQERWLEHLVLGPPRQGLRS